MPNLKERLLSYYHLSLEDYEKRVLPPSFSSLPTLAEKDEVKKAIARLAEAQKRGEKILIYGDYDTDGIMSCSILLRSFREKGLQAEGYLPSRYLDGYGLTAENVRKIAAKGFKIIFTCDNGVTAFDALNEAQKLGLEVLVLDHHEFAAEKPLCFSCLHPDLLAIGETPISAGFLAYLFASALLGKKDEYLLTLAALSTLSDMMPLRSYNRELVRLGLSALHHHHYPEITSLSEKSYIDENTLQMEIIPKINAVGRLKEGNEINRLLAYFAAERPDKQATARWLEEVNEERKNLTKAAQEGLSIDPNEAAIVVQAPIKEGLNGLLANRLLQQYEKPIAVFSPSLKDPHVLVGSLRSKEGFNILKALEGLGVSFLSSGGHAFAGGVAIHDSDYPAFKKAFLFAALKHQLTPVEESFVPLEMGEISLASYKLVQSFGPFGQEWKAPLFALRGLDSDAFTYAKNGLYLSMPLNPEARLFSFSLNENSFQKGEKTDLAVSLRLHEYQGRYSLDVFAEEKIPSRAS